MWREGPWFCPEMEGCPGGWVITHLLVSSVQSKPVLPIVFIYEHRKGNQKMHEGTKGQC